jgi:hypothetical protein
LLCALLAQAALAQSPPGVVQRSANLANPASGLCLDVAESRPRDGMNVQLGACTNATAVWDVVEVGRDEIALVNRITQRVLDVAGGSGDNGANVQQYTWNGSAAQRWRFEARVNSTHLVNVGSGKCLDIANRGTTAGSNVTQWACHDGSNQQWRFANRQPSSFGSGSPSNPPLSIPGEPSLATPPGSALPAGASQIRLVNDRLQGRRLYAGMLVSRQSGKCLDLESARNVDGTNVQQWTCHGGPGQLWDFLDAGKGEVVIVSRASNNKVLDVSGASGADGANIAQYFWNGGANQRWRLEAVDGGFFRLVSVGSGKCADLDTSRDAGRDGANVLQWSCHDKPNQQWRIEVRGSGDRWSSYRPSASLPAPDTSYADRPPSGIVGTWRGYNEAYQSEVTLTIREDGTASAIVDRDIRVSGYYRRGVLYLGTERYTLSTSRGELISRLAGQNTNAVRYQRVR